MNGWIDSNFHRWIDRHHRLFSFSYIKLSSPNLNNVMLIGAIHIDLSCLCMALDKWFLQSDRLGWACMVHRKQRITRKKVTFLLF